MIRRLALGLVVILSPLAAEALPFTYSFTTGSTTTGDATLAPLLDGLSVSGTFDYDPSAAALPSTTVYPMSIANLSGSVGSWSFSDSSGSTFVGNDTYTVPLPTMPPPADLLSLSADPALGSGAPAALFDLAGFDLAGYTLVNVRLFWIESFIAGTPDFLVDDNLPGTLPSFVGRLALDFTPTATPGQLSYVFFDGLLVAQVPEPGTLALLAMGLLGLAIGRTRRLVR